MSQCHGVTGSRCHTVTGGTNYFFKLFYPRMVNRPKECEGLETIHGFPSISIQVELVSTPVYGYRRYSRSTETRPEVRFLVFPVSSCCWSMFARVTLFKVARYASYVNAGKACDDTNDTWHGNGKTHDWRFASLRMHDALHALLGWIMSAYCASRIFVMHT